MANTIKKHWTFWNVYILAQIKMSLNFQVYNIGLFYRKYSPQTGTLKDLASIAVNLQKEEDYLAYLRVYITQQCLHRSAFHHGW